MLAGNHSATVVDAALQQGIAGVEVVLGFKIDYQLDEFIILIWNQGREADIEEDGGCLPSRNCPRSVRS